MILPPMPAVEEVPAAKVQINPENLRKTYDLESLIDSVRTVGMLQPPGVWRDVGRDCYHVVWGNRRVACAKALEWDVIPARVFHAPLPPGMGDKYQIIENVLRTDLKPSEEALGYRRVLDAEGLSAAELAAAVAVAPSTVAKKLALLRLIPALLDRVDSGELPERAGYELAGLDEAAQFEIAHELDGRVSCDEVSRAVRERLGKRGASKPALKNHTFKRGRVRLTVAVGSTLDQALDELDELRKEWKAAQTKGLELAALAKAAKSTA